MAIPVLIIEDNPSAAKALAGSLAENANLNVVGMAETLAEGEQMIFDIRPSLVFLDIELPDGNGIEFWDAQRQHIPWNIYVIFYTAHDKYVINALRAKAHDYLIKPVIRQDVQEAIQRFLFHCAEKMAESSVKEEMAGSGQQTVLMVADNVNNRIVLRPEDIGYFHYMAERKQWEAFCSNGESYVLRHGINATRLLNLDRNFRMVHKSYIINLSYMSRIENNRIVLLPPFHDVDGVVLTQKNKIQLMEDFLHL